MTRNNLSPSARVCVRPRRALSALPALAILLFAGHTFETKAQTNAARPVARLVGSSTPRAVPVPSSAPAAPARCAAAARTHHAETSAATSFAPNGFERRAFALVNEERRARGQEPLRWDAELARVARRHSENMARENFFSHTDKRGLTMAGRAAAEGVCGWRALAENIAYNQGYDDPAAFAVERWMHSAKHRENILRAAFTHAAVGVTRTADGRVYFTQVFVAR